MALIRMKCNSFRMDLNPFNCACLSIKQNAYYYFRKGLPLVREMESCESTEKKSILSSFPNSWYSRTTKIPLRINDEQEKKLLYVSSYLCCGTPCPLGCNN